ncbi:MAG: hypothetical protein AABX28_00660 [Nanoarchaeota archaeon]
MKNKKAQEEMVGFALIIIVVAVILLVFLSFSLRTGQKEPVESYEVESFIQSFLQYTSDCSDNFGNMEIQELIFACNENIICVDERDTCEVLRGTLTNIVGESWKTGSDRPVKGYELLISSSSGEIMNLIEGERTTNLKGATQPFFKGGESFDITFTAYYESN